MLGTSSSNIDGFFSGFFFAFVVVFLIDFSSPNIQKKFMAVKSILSHTINNYLTRLSMM